MRKLFIVLLLYIIYIIPSWIRSSSGSTKRVIMTKGLETLTGLPIKSRRGCRTNWMASVTVVILLQQFCCVSSKITNLAVGEKTGIDFLDLYDKRNDVFLGLKLSTLLPSNISVTTGGSVYSRSFVLETQADYTGTFSASADVAAGMALRGFKASLDSAFSFKKFGTNKKEALIGLIVLERVVKTERVDPCDPVIYANLQQHMLSETTKATHVTIGFVTTIRVEIAFIVSRSSLANTTTMQMKLDLDAIADLISGSASAKGSIQKTVDQSSSLRYSLITSYSNAPIPLKYLSSKDQIDKYLADLYDYVSVPEQQGSRSEAILLDLPTVAACLGTETPNYTYPIFSAQLANVITSMYKDFEFAREKTMEFYERFHAFRSCFSEAEQLTVSYGALKVIFAIQAAVDNNTKEVFDYRQGELDLQSLVIALPVRSYFLHKNLTSLKTTDYGYSTELDNAISLFELLSTYGVQCWPASKHTIMFDSSYDTSSRKMYLFSNFSNLYTSRHDLQNFGKSCISMACPKCSCFLVNCAYKHEICNNVTMFPSVQSYGEVFTIENDDLAKNAFFYIMTRMRYSDLIMKFLLENQIILTDWSREQSPSLNSKLKNLEKIRSYFYPPNSSNLNPVEKFLGEKIVYNTQELNI